MTLLNQSAFATFHDVSRKTVTLWKTRGWLVFEGDLVNVEASNTLLKKYRREGIKTEKKSDKKSVILNKKEDKKNPILGNKKSKGNNLGNTLNVKKREGNSLSHTFNESIHEIENAMSLSESLEAISTPSETPSLKPGESVQDAALRIIAATGADMDFDEARRVKENYLALLNQLEYDRKSRAVVDVDDIAKMVGDDYAHVRTRLLAIPAEQAPRLHRIKTVVSLQDALQEVIVEALEELMCDNTTDA